MLQRSFLHGLFACVFAFSNLTTSPAIADDEREYVVKVSLIQKIVGFVNPISKQAKIEVCVLGDNRLISLADAIHKKDQKISLVKETKLNNVSSHCNVLFIGTAEAEEYKDAIDVLKNKPVLTIGDSSDFIVLSGVYFSGKFSITGELPSPWVVLACIGMCMGGQWVTSVALR